MKIKVLHKVFSCSMAFLVLFSTLSFTIESHYCGSRLIDVSIFAEAEKCGMEVSEKNQVNSTKKSCCKDEIEVVEGQKKLKQNGADDLNFGLQLFINFYAYSLTNLFESLPKQVIAHEHYSPPLLIFDIQAIDEAFLI